MTSYKEHLLNGLMEHGWEQVRVDQLHSEPWLDETWTIRSVRENWGFTLVIAFLTGASEDGPGKGRRAARGISCGTWRPVDYPSATSQPCMWIGTGHFQTDLARFLERLSLLRRGPYDAIQRYAELMTSDSLLLARMTDHTELHSEWASAWRPVSTNEDLPVDLRRAGDSLDQPLRQLTDRRQSLLQLVARPGWRDVQAAARELLKVLSGVSR